MKKKGHFQVPENVLPALAKESVYLCKYDTSPSRKYSGGKKTLSEERAVDGNIRKMKFSTLDLTEVGGK